MSSNEPSSTYEREPGELDMKQIDELHQHLMRESAMYRTAHENKLVGLMTNLQLREVERRMAEKAKDAKFYPKYHYRVNSFCPRTDICMGRWGFTVELDYQYARKLVAHKITPEAFKRLTDMAEKAQEAVFKSSESQWSFPRRRTYQFWEDTCLLTNVTVEPGNACGLDMEWGTFEQVKRGNGGPWAKVDYLPHNVDSVHQAAALLAVWTIWYDHAEALMSSGGTHGQEDQGDGEEQAKDQSDRQGEAKD